MREHACAGSSESAVLVDAHGRQVSYLRVSLTDRCNFRCTYCSPAHPAEATGLLSRVELSRLFRLFARLGVRRIRLTGGEPTLRRDVVQIAGDAVAATGVQEVALTTNGHRLAELARPLHAAGIRAINVSLDTLRPDRLMGVSGRTARLDRILAGIDAAAGRFASLKLNTVVMRGVNEDELGELVSYAWDRGALPRFIEQMPFGGGATVPLAVVRRLLEAQGFALVPDAWTGWGPARHMRAQGPGGRAGLIGFIGPITEGFCERCNRARLTARGRFQACLVGNECTELLPPLRSGVGDDQLIMAIRSTLSRKGPRHHMVDGGVSLPSMCGVGG